MGLFYSEYQYLEYSNNIKEIFPTLVNTGTHFLHLDEGFYGTINGNEFYFYKNHPFVRNSFKTVLYGEIIDDHTIRYRYGKFIWVLMFVLFVDLSFLSGLALVIPSILSGADTFLLIWAALVIMDPDAKHTLSISDMHGANDYTCYEGMELTGRIEKVYSRGKLVADNNEFVGSKGYGEYLKRGTSSLV